VKNIYIIYLLNIFLLLDLNTFSSIIGRCGRKWYIHSYRVTFIVYFYNQ